MQWEGRGLQGHLCTQFSKECLTRKQGHARDPVNPRELNAKLGMTFCHTGGIDAALGAGVPACSGVLTASRQVLLLQDPCLPV